MNQTLIAAMLAGAVSLPAAGLACGGLFCNTNQPINQAAERILFAQDGPTTHMHVRLTYAGPPTDFGWLLPVPPDVETRLSSEELFDQLDANFAPRFVLQRDFPDDCNRPLAADNDGAGGGPEGVPGGVQVLSREAVGPYDQVILRGEDIESVLAWLEENDFQVPEGSAEKLTPYLEMGSAFVALKLLPGTDSGDIQPLELVFTGQLPAVPIVPTSVAADPDMGLIVHLLGDHRAIPKNYAHVQINDAAIDWFSGGQNYADVVSAAADEAQGKAWVTDYAGPSAALSLAPYDAAMVAAVAEVQTVAQLEMALENGAWLDADVQRALQGSFELPEGVPADQFFSCRGCFGQWDGAQAFDGAALAAAFTNEINPARRNVEALFGQFDYLTRLYTTLSPSEMDLDPIFSFNRDLDPVPNVRTARLRVRCDDNNFTPNRGTLVTADGLVVGVDGAMPDPITRQDGRTVRGEDTPAARVVEEMFEQGPPQIIEDRTNDLLVRYADTLGDAGGCACEVRDDAAPSSGALLGLLALLGLRRRRR